MRRVEAARPSTRTANWFWHLVKAIEIVGKAAYQVPREARETLPEMPWEDIVGMRHRLVHACFDINLDILW